eukprot:Gregarina_sp_Poly_1__9479@NODE_595_length_7272_cov_31_818598_g460_i0_p1_GENE_NODE_595_length_7272_cov_31_818598_g460_i0NODE_595_length_7272_cov_31_818598_g460_i0_p1_ORF_typecomplete_len1611_score182_56Phosphodiest/PF01663_22/0_34_NODE_595_length_7272_cov_31_818598_g460_i03555187
MPCTLSFWARMLVRSMDVLMADNVGAVLVNVVTENSCSSARHYLYGIGLTALLASAVFVYTIFLQYIPSSNNASHPTVYPGPSLFVEFEHISNTYCHGVHGSPNSWNDCEAHIQRAELPILTSSPSTQSWVPAPFKRAVLILLDAWRFDWALWRPSKSGSGFESEIGSDQKSLANFNNYPFVHELLRSTHTRKQSRLFRVLADSPTLTTQRLRGLMCGDVAPFFDLSKSLAGSLVERQDSLPYQLHRSSHRRVAALGDDTWDRLFHEYLATVLIDEGFDIHDIETVDNGVHQRLWNILDNSLNSSQTPHEYQDQTAATKYVHPSKTHIFADYDLVVAHLLGLDHIGHSSLIQTSAVSQRQDLYDKLISNVVLFLSEGNLGHPFFSHNRTDSVTAVHAHSTAVPFSSQRHARSPRWNDDTFMAAFGDHGMTAAGNHGGSTKPETETAWFFVSPRSLVDEILLYGDSIIRESLPSTTTRKLEDPMDPILEPTGFKESALIQSHNYTFRSFDQVDIATTLSFLLGTPIPWDSLGGIVAEMIPLYEPSKFWRFDKNESVSVDRTVNGVELVEALSCGEDHTHKDTHSYIVTHPLAPGGILNEADDLECRLAFPKLDSTGSTVSRVRLQSAHIFYEGDWRVTRNSPMTTYRISRLSWLRHLRYLAELHHWNAWQLRRRQFEISRIRPSVIEDKTMADFWVRSQDCFEAVRLRHCGTYCCHSQTPWYTIFGAAESIDTNSVPLGVALRKLSPLENGTLTMETVEQDIRAISILIANYRNFIFEVQDILRQVQSSNFKERSAKWFGIFPLGCTCVIVLFWNPNFAVPRSSFFPHLPRLLKGSLFLGFIVFLFFDGVGCSDPEAYSAAGLWFVPRGSGWVIVCWASLCKLFYSFWTARDQVVPGHRATYSEVVWGLLPRSGSNVDSWAALLSVPAGAITFGNLVDKIHWLLLPAVAAIQFGSGMAVDFQHLSARIFVHGYLALLFCKGLHYIFQTKSPNCLDVSPIALALSPKAAWSLVWSRFCQMIALPFRPRLLQVSHPTMDRYTVPRFTFPWLLLAVLVRLDDFTSPNFQTPKYKEPRPISVSSPDLLIVLVVALLLYQLFPFETPSENFQRFFESQSRLSLAQTAHFVHHLFLPHKHDTLRRMSSLSAPLRTPVGRLPKRQYSGPARFDPDPLMPSIYPEGCLSGNYPSGPSIDHMSPTTFSPGEPSTDQWLAGRWPLAHLIVAAIWIGQCVICCLYFNCLSRSDFVGINKQRTELHSRLLRSIAFLFGIRDQTLRTLDTTKALVVLLPRMNFCLGFLSMMVVLALPYNEAFSLKFLGSLFFLCLPLQAANEVTNFCLQAFKLFLVPIAVSQTISVAQFETVLKSTPKPVETIELSAPVKPTETETALSLTTETALVVSTTGVLAKKFCELVDHHRTNKTVTSYKRELRLTRGFEISKISPQSTSETDLRALQTRYLYTDNEVAVLVYLLMWEIFFGTGHRTDLNTIPLNAGFVGLTGFNLYLSPLLVLLHCGFAFIACPFLLLHALERRPSLFESFSYRVISALSTMGKLMLIVGVWCNVENVYRLRTSLVTWRGYAPKFLIELTATVLVAISFFIVLKKTKRAELSRKEDYL